MSLPLLAVLAIPLFLGPWTTHRTYERVEARLKSAIATDNASIVVGRAGREALEAWRHMEMALEIAEPLHHVAHLCARTPGPNVAACAAQDEAWEALWETRLTLLETTTRAAWKGAEVLAHVEGARLGVALALANYNDAPPVTRHSCPICGGKFQIVWTDPPRPRISADLESTRLQWVKRASGEWQYRLAGGGNEIESRHGSL